MHQVKKGLFKGPERSSAGLMNNSSVQESVSVDQWRFERDPVPDWYYIARLGPSTKLPFHEREGQRINFEAKIVRPIGNPPPGFWQGNAYGHLYSHRRCSWRGLPPRQDWGPIERVSQLTQFLKTFGLYRPGMSTARRVQAAKEFIGSSPPVVVSTVWVAYSRQQQRTFKKGMLNFPRRADGTHDPYVVTDKGEQIRAVAHVHDYWRLKSFPDYAGSNLRHQFTRPEMEACYGLTVEQPNTNDYCSGVRR